MASAIRRARDAFRLVRQGHSGRVLHAARIRLGSRFESLGLRRDLTLPFPAPPARVELAVRPLEPNDDLSFLDIGQPGLAADAAHELLYRRRLVSSGLPTCWVALGPDGKPWYMQWLIGPTDNDRIRAEWGGLFPRLGPDEALLEGAYTVESARGQGVMAHAMARIAAAAARLGVRHVVTFVEEPNIASLKGCRNAGFRPYTARTERWLLLRRSVSFSPLPEGTLYPFEQKPPRAASGVPGVEAALTA